MILFTYFNHRQNVIVITKRRKEKNAFSEISDEL